MDDSGDCCVIISTRNEVEIDPAPQVTHIQAVPSPPPPNAERRNKEETPSFEDRGGVQDNSKLKQGRLLFLTSTSKTSTGKDVGHVHCVDSGAKASAATVDMGTKNTTDVGASENEVIVVGAVRSEVVPLVTSPSTETGATSLTPPQAPPKVVRAKLTKEQREAMRLERERQRAERERQRAQKEREKAEAKAKREEEREIRKLEKQRKEEEKKERQRKREQETKERQQRRESEEQMRKKRKEQKEEERKRREEERKRLELEKEQAREEKLRKELQGQKRISSFFHVLSPKGTVQNKTSVDSDFFVLTPFPTKPDVTMATPPRPPLQDSTHFDWALTRQDSSVGRAYLEECKHKPKLGRVGERKEKEEECDKNKDVECMEIDNDDDVVITSPDVACPRGRNICYKLLQFHTNHRPAYFGTWRKRSKLITPRNPFKKDTDLLDYEVDSDDEWEEEEPGESLSNSEGEDGGESGDDEEEEEDGFFVPHGYLSDSEGDHSGDEGTLGQDNQDLKQQKQVSKAKAWEAEFARKCQPLRPIKIGCIWTSGRGAEQHQEGGVVTVSKDMEFLQQFEAVPLVELPVAIETKGETTAEGGSTGAIDPTKPRAVPEEAMPDLIRLVHKNSMGLGRLMKTFREYWGAKVTASGSGDPVGTRERNTSPSNNSTKATLTENSPFCKPKTPGLTGNGSELENASGISKRQLERKIQSMAVKEARPPSHKQLWYVHDSVLQKYGIDGTALSPLQVASPSIVARGGENSTGVNSPQTPCGSGVASVSSRKRKPLAKGMKSLFDFVNSASSTTANSSAAGSGGGDGQPPSLKKSRIEEGGSNTAATKPLATLTSSNVQVLPKSTSPPNGMEPPLKKARLDLTMESPKELKSSDKAVIVIDSDDSNDKEKSVEVEKGAANLVDITNTSNAAAPPNMSTGAPKVPTMVTAVAATPTINLLAKLIQQCANASRR